MAVKAAYIRDMRKFTDAEIVRHALVWGEESIGQMIEAHTPDDGPVTDPDHVAYLRALRKQMRAYRVKRFGQMPNPLVRTKRVDAMTTKFND